MCPPDRCSGVKLIVENYDRVESVILRLYDDVVAAIVPSAKYMAFDTFFTHLRKGFTFAAFSVSTPTEKAKAIAELEGFMTSLPSSEPEDILDCGTTMVDRALELLYSAIVRTFRDLRMTTVLTELDLRKK